MDCIIYLDPDHAADDLDLAHPVHVVGGEAGVLRVELHAVSLAQHVALPDGHARLQRHDRRLPPPLVLAEIFFIDMKYF